MFIQNSTDFQNLTKELSEYHIKLIAYAKQADSELKHNIARLFKALSFSKKVQALSILNHVGYIKDTISNIENCLDIDINKDYKEEASFEDIDFIHKLEEIEEKNHHIFLCVKDTLESQKDLNFGAISVCSKCGYTLLGDSPKECIICNKPSGYFRTF